MKRLLTFGASALALSLAATGAAQAQSTIAAEIGPNLIDLIDDEFQAGIGLNIALNTALIDGSVTVGQENFELDFHGEGSLAFGNDDGPFNIGGTAFLVEVDTEVNNVNLGEIATLAVGAINDGTVKFGQAGTSASGSFETSLSAGDIEVGDDIVSSAASTTNTAAAYYEADFYASVGSLSGRSASRSPRPPYGPAQDPSR